MPLSNAQLAALAERAKQKALPVVSLPAPAAQRPARARQAKPEQSATQPPPEPQRPPPRARQIQSAPPPPPEPPQPTPTAVPLPPEHTAEAEDFPIGWYLAKDSWQFHRRYYAIFKRPMRPGEYSHLLKQIRRGEAEHLGEDCWRVTLLDGRTTLPVRAARWRLITILPKNWQPPAAAAPTSSGSSASEHAQEPSV
jgi:hypothetical protein